MKKLAFVVALTVFISCSFTIIWLELRIQEQNHARVERSQMEAMMEAGALQIQEKLARWYNLNLTADRKDRDFTEGYWNILNTEDTAMGYLSIPCLDQKQWIYHGTDASVLEKGVGHIPLTALPIGGAGTHSALVGDFTLDEGDYFYIHILDQVRPYRVTKTEYVPPMEISFSRSGEEELCTLVAETQGGDRVRLIRATYVREAPRESAIPVRQMAEGGDGWILSANLVLILGMLLVPMCMWSRGNTGF